MTVDEFLAWHPDGEETYHLAFVGFDLLRRRPDGSWPEDPERVTEGSLSLESIGFACNISAPYRTTHFARAR